MGRDIFAYIYLKPHLIFDMYAFPTSPPYSQTSITLATLFAKSFFVLAIIAAAAAMKKRTSGPENNFIWPQPMTLEDLRNHLSRGNPRPSPGPDAWEKWALRQTTDSFLSLVLQPLQLYDHDELHTGQNKAKLHQPAIQTRRHHRSEELARNRLL